MEFLSRKRPRSVSKVILHVISYVIKHVMGEQLGRLPKMDREVPGLFTASERIMQDFAKEKKLDATFIKDLIQKVLHHPDFDPD